MNERPEEPNQPIEGESLLPIDEHVEEVQDAEGRKVRHRGIYLLPNLFTTANLFAGFYAIEAADLDEAIAFAAQIPPARYGTIEIRPLRTLVAEGNTR